MEEPAERPELEILICTFNRAELLARTLKSLNAAERPVDAGVEIVVMANACVDDTADVLNRYMQDAGSNNWLPLRWYEEPEPGKSQALNSALPRLQAPLVAMVDDDHWVDSHYLCEIIAAAKRYPEATFFCGRILPDWNGSEPSWAHDTDKYRIYPLPVPRYDQGDESKPLGTGDWLPGGGNLVLRRGVLQRVGLFSSELGPKGHDLAGGEDNDYVRRALAGGECLQYVPAVVQLHVVETERFRLLYILRKSYQRSCSGTSVKVTGRSGVPRYMWRKLATYMAKSLFSLSFRRTRFYLVRTAATLGEISGFRKAARQQQVTAGSKWRHVLACTLIAAASLGVFLSGPGQLVMVAASVAFVWTLILVAKSVRDYTRTGPRIREEVQRYYRRYGVAALMRLAFWSFLVSGYLALAGSTSYHWMTIAFDWPVHLWLLILSAVTGILLITGLQFCRHLLYIPGSIVASSHYRMTRFIPLWRHLSPGRLGFVQGLLAVTWLGLAAAAVARQGFDQSWSGVVRELPLPGLIVGLFVLATWYPRSKPRVGTHTGERRPNIVMIGSDTLRADRLGVLGNKRQLTPFIDKLAGEGVCFADCYVPIARTAPSLVSYMTGAWPQKHGIYDNFVADPETDLGLAMLPGMLAQGGYRTAVISDWAGSDYGKFPFGFDHVDVPPDQWNLRYLIRQGPKDIRLFLSLFTHNRFGEYCLPELYYLAGVPMGRQMTRKAKDYICARATEEQPFFLNLFMATTHQPFSSEYPYYTLFSDPEYAGESKFAMSRLTEPMEIIRSQQQPKEAFDLQQIVDLYDGAVRGFDDQVRDVCQCLEQCGLMENTILVIYSDHGMEFFEKDTWGQGNSIYSDYSNRVPVVMRGPGVASKGMADTTVRSVDLAPTLLELVGLQPAESMDGTPLLANGEPCSEALPAYCETGLWLAPPPNQVQGHLGYPSLLEILEIADKHSGTISVKQEYKDLVRRAKDRMIRSGDWKLVCIPLEQGFEYSLYDLRTDSDCNTNVAEKNPGIVEELRIQLEGLG